MRPPVVSRLSPLVVLVSLVASCGDAAPPEPPPGPPGPDVRSDLDRDLAPEVSPDDLGALVAGNTAFAADLYRAVRTGSGNLFFSPHSISTALAMTYAGTEGTTEAQMKATLHFTLPEPALHAALNRLDLELASRATQATGETRPFRLHTANSIWGQRGKTFLAPFLDTLAVNYGAGLRVVDFAADADAARGTINDWVAGATEQKIKDLLPRDAIKPTTTLVLTNAIYFSAAWQHPFKVEETHPSPFTTASGVVEVPTLHQVAELGYGAGTHFRAAELPYDGGQLSMIVVVPDLVDDESGDPLSRLEAELTAAKLAEIQGSIQTAQLTLSLPKFRFDAPLRLKTTLSALGMVDAFVDAAADLSGMDGTRGLVIGDVIHKGFVGIDEAGTEAAAATAVVVGPPSVPPPAELSVDRPFLFFIVDRPTGAILFLGRVVDPRS